MSPLVVPDVAAAVSEAGGFALPADDAWRPVLDRVLCSLPAITVLAGGDKTAEAVVLA